MTNRKKLFKSLACALALLANGAAPALAQQQQQPRERQPERDVLIDKERVVITSMQGGPGTGPHGDIVIGGGGPAMSFAYIASEMSFDSRVVKGAPFSAEAVSESSHTLADGNRISRKTTASYYRDSEGRTRREETPAAAGPFAPSGDAHNAIFINDPVAGVNYILNPSARTATKLSQHFAFERREGGGGPHTTNFTMTMRAGEGGVRQLDNTRPITAGTLNGRAIKGPVPSYPAVARAAKAEGRVMVEVTVGEDGKVMSARATDGHPLLREAAVEAARQWEFAPTRLSNQPVKVTGNITFNFVLSKQDAPGGFVPPPAPPAPGEPPPPPGEVRMRLPAHPALPRFEESKESLGKQTVEGVEAEGTRTTVTIPAGAIGNERPILITSERWYSPELKVVVMTKHSDPRFGETTYRLTNITRAEPDRTLFEVPSDYTVQAGGPFGRGPAPMRMRRPANQQ